MSSAVQDRRCCCCTAFRNAKPCGPAPQLAHEFTVICALLRGHGDSAKPHCLPDKSNYSFRAMADDQIALMRALGFSRFQVAGHDRGARTAYRMALDHPAAVQALALMDIVPTIGPPPA